MMRYFCEATGDMIRDLTYDKAVSNQEKVLIKGSFTKADVFIARSGGVQVIVKDFSKKGFWERNLIGRMIIGREANAYAALAGIDGIPSHFKRLSPFAIAIEYLEGKDLGGLGRGEIGPGVMLQFERIIDDLHERGWVHLDLHRRTNILLIGGKVFVVDLASALHAGSIPFFGRYFTRLIGLADRLSLIKMKTIFSPELMTTKDRKLLKIRNIFLPSKW
jgi:predicted Ser/Thr protein kinase